MISVIIPVYNGEKTIGSCLDSLLNQVRKPDEIIVIDDSSSDRTKDIVKKHRHVIMLEQMHKGPAAARNFGAKKAKGDILLFTDADCTLHENWVSEMAKPFDDKAIVGVQGRYSTTQKSVIARFVQLEIEDRYDRMKRFKHIDFIGSYSAGYKKDIFIRSGGFDETFPVASGEDPELSFKLAKAGHKMVFNDKAIVYHNHVTSLGTYLKQKFSRAYWRVLLYKKHPDKMASESYTPQTLKVQIAFLFLSLLLAMLYFLMPPTAYFSSLFAILLLVSTIPLSLKNFRKDKIVGILTPFISILRTAVFGIGLVYGAIKL